MLGLILIFTTVELALVVGFVFILMRASRRWLHFWVSLGIGGMAVIYFVQSIVRGMLYCSLPPVDVPSDPRSDGNGMMVFNCDSAGGVVDRFYLYCLGPATVLVLLYLVWRIWEAGSYSCQKAHPNAAGYCGVRMGTQNALARGQNMASGSVPGSEGMK